MSDYKEEHRLYATDDSNIFIWFAGCNYKIFHYGIISILDGYTPENISKYKNFNINVSADNSIELTDDSQK